MQETSAPTTDDSDGSTTDSETVATEDTTSGVGVTPALFARIKVDISSGALPLTVRFDASSSVAVEGVASWEWRFGDEEVPDTGEPDTGEVKKAAVTDGPVVTHTYLRAGPWSATLTLTDASGQVDTERVLITVEPPNCPAIGKWETVGTVESEELVEASGVVASRRTPGVLWSHNDAGDDPRLFALSTAGRHLGTWTLNGVPDGDWEDIAALMEGDEPVLYVGNIGDNNHDNEAAVIYRVVEPVVPDPASGEAVEASLDAQVMTLTYPDGYAYDAEALVVDPATSDLYIVTKDYTGPAEVFRKAAPHTDGEAAVLEHVASLDFSKVPLFGGATTGAALSPDGEWMVIRTYRTTAFLWQTIDGFTLWESLAADPCEVRLPEERQGESVGFAVDGSGLYTISEGELQPVWFIPLGKKP